VDFRFHDHIEKSWAILFSHPCDYTPVCTTEIAGFIQKGHEFKKRGVKLVGLSASDVKTHTKWIEDHIHSITSPLKINFPIIGDEKGKVACMYDM
jgi:alkyl hydroperoxide reductase subunit AhpC